MRRVLVVGNSLFAEAIAQLLSRSEAVDVVGSAADVSAALALAPACQPDAVVVLDDDDVFDLCPLLTAYPDLPILRAGLHSDGLRVIRSQRLDARPVDLLAAIQDLPPRR